MAAREKRARTFAVCVYLLVGWFAVVLGGHDALFAPEISSRSMGTLLALGGLVLLAMAFALALPAKRWSSRRRWVPRAGMWAAAIGVLIGGSLIVAQMASPDAGSEAAEVSSAFVLLLLPACFFLGTEWLFALAGCISLAAYVLLGGGDHDERVAIWVSIVVFSALAALALWRTKPPPLGISVSKVLLGVFGFASLSALVGLAQFWYTTQYLPFSEKTILSIDSKLHRLGHDRRGEVVEMRVTVKNISSAPAEILGSAYRVSGASGRSLALSDTRVARRLGRPSIYGETVSRYRRGAEWDLVQAGLVFPYGWWLGADEKFSRVALVHVPRGRYDTLRLHGEVLTAKRDALTLDYDGIRALRVNQRRRRVKGLKTIFPIEETSWFRELTRGDRELRVKWVVGSRLERRPSRFPHVRGAITRVGEEMSPHEFLVYQRRTADLYGMTPTVSIAELPLGMRP